MQQLRSVIVVNVVKQKLRYKPIRKYLKLRIAIAIPKTFRFSDRSCQQAFQYQAQRTVDQQSTSMHPCAAVWSLVLSLVETEHGSDAPAQYD